MPLTTPTHGLQLRSRVTSQGELELSLITVPTPVPGADEVVVRIDATPINPSDIGLLLGAAVIHTAVPSGSAALTQALVDTGATIAFDATGGGRLAGQILSGMEAALNRTATEYSRYGSTTLKQVYIYGGLDTSPTELVRNFGFAWSMGGWLLFPFLQRLGEAGTQRLRQRVAAEIKTTFASTYAQEISLAEALQPERIAAYGRRATASKYLINPHKAAAGPR